MKMTGTAKQIEFAASMVEAIKTAAANIQPIPADAPLHVRTRARDSNKLLASMAAILTAFEAVQNSGSADAAMAIDASLDEETAMDLNDLVQRIYPRRMGMKAEDILTKPADAGNIIDAIKGCYYAHCKPA